MDPDATYKSILSYAIMVEELMHWLVADRHGMHALVDALDFSTLTRMHEQSVSDAGAAGGSAPPTARAGAAHRDLAPATRATPATRAGPPHGGSSTW